jgi:oligoendopeptidase F
MKLLRILGVVMVVISWAAEKGRSQTRERSAVPAEQQWRLEDLYLSDEAWRQAKNDLAARQDGILPFKGTLAHSAAQMLSCLRFNSEVCKTLGRLHAYASMKSDQDTRQAAYLAMKQEIEQLLTEYNTRASFLEPEIVAIPTERIEEFLAAEPGLKDYRLYLFDILRSKAHTLSPEEEKILAATGRMAGSPGSVYTVFSNAEMPYPDLTLSDGSVVTLNKASYALHRASPNRADREAVFQAFWAAHNKFRQTLGIQLYSHLQTHVFYTRTRNYESSLHRALDKNNIPIEVYHSLIRNVRDNLGTFHRYLRLRQRMLGVDTLKYSDLYAPVVKDLDRRYTFDEARDLYLDSLELLGTEYRQAAQRAFEQRWIDVYPTPGKRSGAYSNGGAYDVHPYILLNYNSRLEDVSTLAHEMGHALHSFYANRNQPYPLADYSTFVAEVASTFNETLLIHTMLSRTKEDEAKLFLLMNYLDGIKGTVFRQTQFAEFELKMHEKADRGAPLTGDTFTELYGRILKEYYGHDQGVCLIDDLYAMEWAYIPHFYYNFYVYQYSTSFTAATALAEEALGGKEGAAQRYLQFISAGGSDYPIEELKKAGVDMTTAEPFRETMAVMNRLMDEIDTILARREGR